MDTTAVTGAEARFVELLADDEDTAVVLLPWQVVPGEHRPREAAAILTSLLGRDLVEVLETYDFNPNRPRVLTREEALKGMSDERKWRDPAETPFARIEPYSSSA